MTDYQGKKVVIIGLGLTGLSCVDFFIARGVTPRVMDTRISPPGLEKLPEAVERHTGSLNEDWLLEADLIIASPGIARSPSCVNAVRQMLVLKSLVISNCFAVKRRRRLWPLPVPMVKAPSRL